MHSYEGHTIPQPQSLYPAPIPSPNLLKESRHKTPLCIAHPLPSHLLPFLSESSISQPTEN